MRPGLLWGLCFAVMWVSADWLLRTIVVAQSADPRVLLMSLGVAAPFGLVFAELVQVSVRGWRQSGSWSRTRK